MVKPVQFELPLAEVAHARRTDPETSHEAAAGVSEHLRARQNAVLRILRRYGPMEHTTLIEVYRRNMQPAGPELQQSESGIRTRCKELVTKGLVRDTGRKVILASGYPSTVWEAVP